MKLALLAIIPALVLPAFVGCESTTHSTTVDKTWDGGTKVKDTTVTDHGNGNVSMDQKTTKIPG